MKKITLLLFCMISISAFGQIHYTQYSKAEVEEDINYIFEKLTKIHPLFLDTHKLSQYQAQFSEIKEGLKDNMTPNDIYLFMAPIFASLNDGHTGIMVPVNQRIEYTKAQGKAFPFFVNIIKDSLYVSFYCGNDASLLHSGEQILKINGIDATEMIHAMEAYCSGETPDIRQKTIAENFRNLLWILYGFENDYELIVKNTRNEIKKITVPGVTNDEFIQNKKHMPKTNQKAYTLEIKQDIGAAVLTIKSFEDLDGFCTFVDSAFTIINEGEIQNLIIDIRNNGGGRSVVVDSLMNYLTDKAYTQYKKVEVRISSALKEHYAKNYPDRIDWINNYAIDKLVVLEEEVNQPNDNDLRFYGNLFLLTNSASYSAASTFAGVFKDLQLGAIIGEETGGTISYYGDFWALNTPNSKIDFYVSPKRFIQHGGEAYNRGVIPHFIISDKGDAMMNVVYKLIKQ